MPETSVWFVAGPSGGLIPNFQADGNQQFHHRQFRIENEGHFRPFGQHFQQAPAGRGFACADVAGQQDKAPFVVNSVRQMGQGLGVSGAQKKIIRVGDDGKRLL
jgi:hypothetical protein